MTPELSQYRNVRIAKQPIGRRMGSVATQGEGAQNLLCAYIAAALLIGLAGNALFGIWWLDPAAALAIAALAVREGVEAWRGESCCIPSASAGTHDCTDDSCAAASASEPPGSVQCQLDLSELRDQADRYRRLGLTATYIERHDDVLTVAFGDKLDARLLSEAIAVERGCCPFFRFDYRPAIGRLWITVQRPEQRPALEALHYALTGRGTGQTVTPAA
jgi:hypothetical protein